MLPNRRCALWQLFIDSPPDQNTDLDFYGLKLVHVPKIRFMRLNVFRLTAAVGACLLFMRPDLAGAERPLFAASAEDVEDQAEAAVSQAEDDQQSDPADEDIISRQGDSSLTRSSPYSDLGADRYEFRSELTDRGSVSPSATGWAAARERDRVLAKAEEARALKYYNVKIGSMLFWFDAGLTAEYSDNVISSAFPENISRSDSNSARRARFSDEREDDFIIRPTFNMHGFLKLTKYNSLNLELGLGYVKYLNHPELDQGTSSLYIAPGSDISFDVKVGDVMLNFHERPSIPHDQADLLTLRNTFRYSRFVNVIGVSAVWDLNRVVLSAGYDHEDVIALRSELEYLDQSSEHVFANAVFKLNESISVGVETGASLIDYKEDFQNDGMTYHGGPFAEIRLTEFLHLRIAAGMQGGEFESGGGNGDSSDLREFYANATLSHQLNAYFHHRLSLGREAQLGTNSNFVKVNFARYAFTWDIFNRASFGGDAHFEDAEESGGIFAQDVQRYGCGVFWSYMLTKKLAVGLHYRFTKRDSSGSSPEGSSLDYHENRVGVDFRYTF